MADLDMRTLERKATSGDIHDVARLLTARQRSCSIPALPAIGDADPLSGEQRIQLAAYAGDEVARLALAPELKRWLSPPNSDMIRIPACDSYEWEPWLDVLRRKFGGLPAIAAVIGAARVHWDDNFCPPKEGCNCGERDTCLACQTFCEVRGYVDDALDVFEDWIKEPTSSNLVKLAGRADYGVGYQRLFEGCDALASSHPRGGVIFWEGARSFRTLVTEDVMRLSMRRAVAALARSCHW